ncbi:MAG: GGDEF domain-containing protein [Planctomycetota bacterium]|jgi:diguanylate cyclase (GGDEF)-like protein
MSSAGPPQRASGRGRVVLVGDPNGIGALPRVSPPLPREIIRAANLFDAVGEVKIATAASPVSAVVVPVDCVRTSAPAAVEAFRRVDPSVRLILLAASKAELAGIDTMAASFDDVVVETAAEAEVSGDPSDTSVPGDDARRAGPSPAPPRRPAPPPASHRPPGGADVERLGDTDLVDAILTEPAGLCERALQLMSQQTRWSDLALTSGRPRRDGAACVEVRYGPRSYGMLSSGQATERQLRPWSEWLARWLALDQGYRDFRMMAFRDELTGAWNRRFYQVFMRQTIRNAGRRRQTVSVMVFDIDDLKKYNDQFGHQAGDEVLRETVRLLNSVIRTGDRVCRIGGDEFVVIFADPEGPRKPGSNPPETVEEIASRFQDQICQMKFPKLGLDAPGALSISAGLATYPWDGVEPQTLLRHADELALQSKRKGKNAISYGPQTRPIHRSPGG